MGKLGYELNKFVSNNYLESSDLFWTSMRLAKKNHTLIYVTFSIYICSIEVKIYSLDLNPYHPNKYNHQLNADSKTYFSS